MKETQGKVTVELVEKPDDPQITLTITAPKTDWQKLRTTLGKQSSTPEFVSYGFYRAVQIVVDTL